jgi:hypothetical protein
MEVRCGHNCISAGPVSSRVRTHSTETSVVFKNKNFRTLDKGRVQTLKKISQATVEQGEGKTRNFRRLQWSRVRTPQATHRQGEGKTGHFLRLHTGRVRAKQDISSGYTQAG